MLLFENPVPQADPLDLPLPWQPSQREAEVAAYRERHPKKRELIEKYCAAAVRHYIIPADVTDRIEDRISLHELPSEELLPYAQALQAYAVAGLPIEGPQELPAADIASIVGANVERLEHDLYGSDIEHPYIILKAADLIIRVEPPAKRLNDTVLVSGIRCMRPAFSQRFERFLAGYERSLSRL